MYRSASSHSISSLVTSGGREVGGGGGTHNTFRLRREAGGKEAK